MLNMNKDIDYSKALTCTNVTDKNCKTPISN